MLTKQEFTEKIAAGYWLLDGGTGTNLRAMGMPREACAEEWILAHPEKLLALQKSYVNSGSKILLAPTFQATPAALERVGLAGQTERVNAALVALSRAAGPGCLIAGDMTTMAGVTESWDTANFDFMVENYRRQIRGLLDGGADFLFAETLVYPQEAEAIFTAACLEEAGAAVFSFTMQPDGTLFSGADAREVLRELERMGAAAVGFNCVAAGADTAALVSRLRRQLRAPLVCKPNAGMPTIDAAGNAVYPMGSDEFAGILADCRAAGATLLGGCCGTDAAYIAAFAARVRGRE